MTNGADPILVGVLYDFPQADEGAGFEEALRLGIAEVVLDRPVELVPLQARGLPMGTAHDVEARYHELREGGVLAIVGPSISDNALVLRDLVDVMEIPLVNYTGGERTRSEFMFHYQVGSLAEEPVVLAQHLAAASLGSAAVVHDRSPVGQGYAESFEAASERAGIEVVGRAAISPLATEAKAIVDRLQAARPEALVYLGLGMSARTVAVAVKEAGWDLPVVANSALMFGYARKDWRAGWEGWVYVDTVSDGNRRRQALKERSPRSAAGPVGVAAYDIGRLVAEGLSRAVHLTGPGVRDGLEQVKRLPAASGRDGTVMGFGPWDHGALKGDYLVLRTWREGKTVEL